MNTYSTLVWLLPIVFMIHDFEEIIFFKPWIHKNRDYLAKKYPKIASLFLRHLGRLSTSAYLYHILCINLLCVHIVRDSFKEPVLNFRHRFVDNYRIWNSWSEFDIGS